MWCWWLCTWFVTVYPGRPFPCVSKVGTAIIPDLHCPHPHCYRQPTTTHPVFAVFIASTTSRKKSDTIWIIKLVRHQPSTPIRDHQSRYHHHRIVIGISSLVLRISIRYGTPYYWYCYSISSLVLRIDIGIGPGTPGRSLTPSGYKLVQHCYLVLRYRHRYQPSTFTFASHFDPVLPHLPTFDWFQRFGVQVHPQPVDSIHIRRRVSRWHCPLLVVFKSITPSVGLAWFANRKIRKNPVVLSATCHQLWRGSNSLLPIAGTALPIPGSIKAN